MRRTLAIVLLAAGTVLGFGWGIARVTGHCPYGAGCFGDHHRMLGAWGANPRDFEQRTADACVRAAERVLNERRASGAATPPAPAP